MTTERCWYRMAAAVLWCTCVMPWPLHAQSILGRLVDSTSGTGVSGALVELHDVTGAIVRHTVTSISGQFLLGTPGPGRYQLHVAAIGYGRHELIPVPVDTADVTVPDIRMSGVVITLRDLVALGGKRQCGTSGVDNATFSRLLDGAEQALQVMEGTVESNDVAFDVDIINRRITGRNQADTLADTTHSAMHNWPVQSIAPDSLRKVGFARPMTSKEGTGWIYYGPDLRVLFSDWFLAGHCFTLAHAAQGDSTLHLRFEPVHHTRNVDIMGEMVLDRQTLALESLSFKHIYFPFGALDGASGGELQFLHVAAGVWLPVRWTLWAPIAVEHRLIARPMIGGNTITTGSLAPMNANGRLTGVTVLGRVETHGELVRVTLLRH
jgi:Carboxypeptidase regulatory-like domain